MSSNETPGLHQHDPSSAARRRSTVSVVLPLHNAQSYLDRTLQLLQALDRTEVDYEFVVVNDHSTDATGEIISRWQGVLEGRVILLDADQRGVAGARNQALANCSGDFVWLVDADDEWSAEIVTKMHSIARESAADVVVCNAEKRTQGGVSRGMINDAPRSEVVDGNEAYVRLLDGRMQGHLWNKLFSRNSLVGDVFPPTRAHSDLGGLLRLLPSTSRIAFLPETLYVYFLNEGSILNSREYRWRDLLECLRLAESGHAARRDETTRTLSEFKYRNVVVPIFNELARRSLDGDPSVIGPASRAVRSVITAREVAWLVRTGHSTLALQSSIIAVAPRTYCRLYRRAKRQQLTRIA